MGAGPQASDRMRDTGSSNLWWFLLLCLLLISAGATAAIAATNSDPIAKDNSYRVHRGDSITRSAPAVLGNDSDPDGDRLSAARATSPRHGKLLLRSNGSFVYTPNERFRGIDSFTYTARDGNGGTDTATVEVTVWPVIRPVLARSDAYHVNEDGILTVQAPGVLRNDAQVDGRRLFATKVSDPTHGSVDLNPDGSFVYTPAPDFNGEDSFIYRAADNRDHSDKGTVSISVGAINDPPAFTGAASNTSQTIDEGSGLAALEATDMDGDTLTFEPMGGSMPEGITLGNDGSFSGTAGSRSAGTYTEDIKVSDGNGGSATTTLGITVNQVDEAPKADDNTTSTGEDVPVTLTLSATDADSDNLTLSASSPGHGTLGTTSAPNCSTSAGLTTCTATVEYTPDADYYGPDSFTYTANDGNSDSSAATAEITVNAVNDAPSAQGDTKTAQENTPLVFPATDLLANDSKGASNEDGQTLSVTEVKNAQHGTVVLQGDEITFTPDPDYNGPASFEYTVCDDGSPQECSAQSATVNVTVSPVNSKPTASATPSGLVIDEDAAAQTITLGGADAETGAANLLFTITEAPTHGVLKKDTTVLGNGDTFTGSPTDVTYKPNADYNGSDSFNFKVADRGDPDNCGAPGPSCEAPQESDVKTVTITVQAINDAPNFDLGADQTVVNTAGAQTVSGFATSISAGPPDESGQTLTFAVTNDDNSLFSVQPDIDETSGDLTFTPDPSASGTATVTVELKDDGGTATGGNDTTTKTFKITVKPPNSPPTASSQSVSVDEDVQKTITLAADDPDGDAVSLFSISDGPDHGTLGSTGTITCDHATPNHCTADVSYKGDADYNGADQFQFTASDAQATGQPATVSITVDAVNDSPHPDNIEQTPLAYTENDPATQITATTTVTDVDSPNFDTGMLMVDFAAGGTADDRLEIRNDGSGPGQIGVSGATVSYEGTAIGTSSGGTGTTPLAVSLNANATPAATQALIRAVTYRNVSDNPSTASRTVRFLVDDGDGAQVVTGRDISLTAVNDPPALAAIESGALGYTENDPATSVTSALTVSDPDSNITGATVTMATNLAPSEDVLSFANQLGITGTYNAATGVLTLTGNAPAADYQTALRAVKYSNSSENPSTLTRNVTFQVKDGPTAGNLSNTQSRDVTVTAVNDAPVADDESFTGVNGAIGNTVLVGNDPSDGAPTVSSPKKGITGDILAGDTDIEGGTLVVQAVTNQATNDGGRVTIEADGDFVYTPAPGTSCTDHSDFFDYTVSDQNATQPGPTPGTDTGRVTIDIAGCVWYVNNNQAGNSGTSDAPFDTLTQAETSSGTNDTVFVFDGDNTSTGYGGDGYAMNAGERLIGEHEGLVVDPDGGGPLAAETLQPANPGAKPTLTASNADVISLDDGNEVRGFVIDPQGTGGGIAGATGDTGGTIGDVDIADAGTSGTQPGLELDATTGTFNVSNLTVSTSGATGVRLNNAGTTNFAPTGTISITTSGAKGLDATGTNMGSASVFDDITVTGSGSGGVSMSTTTGTTTFGDGSGTDLNLTTSSGATPAFNLSNAGTVSVGSAGVDNVAATGGPAIDVTGTSGATLDFDDVDSTSSANDGINLDGLGTGTFSATSGDIGSYSGIAFDLNGGSGAITYPGNLNNGSGITSAEITGRTDGAVTLSGAIADTNDAGGGISLSGNTGGSTTFSNASKILNTTTSDAVSFSASDGHALSITNGGLDIDTTSGQGVVATSSGTITVTGTGNSVSSGTGRAVNVQNTDFGAPGFTFQSVSSNGAPNGILLNNTGTSAGMTITGTGANNSGGTIQNTTGHGVSLTSTNNFNSDELSITGANMAGVDGTDVTNFTFTDGEILNAGDSHTDPLHGSIAFNDQASGTENNIDGTLVITGNLLKDHYGGGVDVFNRSGTISDATISNNTIDSVADEALNKEDAISFNLFGSATTVASLTKAQIEDNVITDHPSGNGITILGAQTNTGAAPTPTVGVPGSSTNRILIDGNLLTGDPTLRFGGAGIQAGVEGRGVGNFDITNNGTAANPIANVGTHGIATGNSGSSEVEYLIQGNYVSANNFEAGALGIRAASDKHIMVGGTTLATPTLKAIIANNVVRNTTGGGIRVLAMNSNGTSEVKVTNNDVANGGAGTYPIRVENGSSTDATFDPTMCATISGNITAANAPTPGGNTFPGIGLFKRSTVAADYQFGIVGLTPSPSTNANTESFVAGLNPNLNLGAGFYAGKKVSVDAGDNFVSCTHPAGF